jgi:hypothetical protein
VIYGGGAARVQFIPSHMPPSPNGVRTLLLVPHGLKLLLLVPHGLELLLPNPHGLELFFS